ncbi:hypothetical protein ACQPW3_08860 [Actinosynnema sp. CA-248983]
MIQTEVEQRLGFNSWTWNKMVRAGEVAEVVDVVMLRSVPWTSATAWRKPPGWKAPENPCPDCEGRCAVKDTDGSITGVRGGWYVCLCTRLAGRGGRG